MIILAIAAGAAALSSPAATMEREPTQSMMVRYGDLDLTTTRGEHRLRTRIANAANLVCGQADARNLQAMSAWRACRAQAMSGASVQAEAALTSAKTRLAQASVPAVAGLNKSER